MHIYATANSPFCARVMIAARAKGIEIETVYPPVVPGLGLRNPEYLAINPVGKIPSLVTDEGPTIPESAAIIEYLEARYPEPSLLAADPAQRASMHAAIRLMDTYVVEPLIRTYPYLAYPRPDSGAPKDEIFAQEVDRWRAGLGYLSALMERLGPWADTPAGVSIADCVLGPALHLSTRISAMHDLDDPMAVHEVLMSYYLGLKAHPLVGPMLDELTRAQADSDAAADRPRVADRHY